MFSSKQPVPRKVKSGSCYPVSVVLLGFARRFTETRRFLVRVCKILKSCLKSFVSPITEYSSPHFIHSRLLRCGTCRCGSVTWVQDRFPAANPETNLLASSSWSESPLTTILAVSCQICGRRDESCQQPSQKNNDLIMSCHKPLST